MLEKTGGRMNVNRMIGFQGSVGIAAFLELRLQAGFIKSKVREKKVTYCVIEVARSYGLLYTSDIV